jgi:hypothetical protein
VRTASKKYEAPWILTKSLDDENLEAHIAIRLKSSRESRPIGDNLGDLERLISVELPTCAHASRAGVDCSECLEVVENNIVAPDQLALVGTLRDVGPLGLPVRHILVSRAAQ